ncbi:MAG: hypothetical protein ABI658_26490 [Acidimicrobiales bacterium]
MSNEDKAPEPMDISPELMAEALDRLEILARGLREKSPLHHFEMNDSRDWVQGSADRAAAVLMVAVHVLGFADDELRGDIVGALRRKFGSSSPCG